MGRELEVSPAPSHADEPPSARATRVQRVEDCAGSNPGAPDGQSGSFDAAASGRLWTSEVHAKRAGQGRWWMVEPASRSPAGRPCSQPMIDRGQSRTLNGRSLGAPSRPTASPVDRPVPSVSDLKADSRRLARSARFRALVALAAAAARNAASETSLAGFRSRRRTTPTRSTVPEPLVRRLGTDVEHPADFQPRCPESTSTLHSDC